MDSLTAVTARIAEIQDNLGLRKPPVQAPTAGFANALQAAQSQRSATNGAATGEPSAAAVTRRSAHGPGASAAWLAQTTSSRTALAERTTTLADRVAGRSGASATHGVSGPTGASGPSGPPRLSGKAPAELAAFGNGRIPAGSLSPIGHGQHRLWAPATAAFRDMERAAKAAGVHIGVTDSYRSFAQQVAVAKEKGLYSQGGLAAKPGTSDHGWGRSLDLRLDAAAQSWMRANAGRYGYAEDVPREPWHWTFTPKG